MAEIPNNSGNYRAGQNSPGVPSGQQPPKIDANALKLKLEDFTKKLLKKFPFTKVLGILPANSFYMFEEDEGVPKDVADSKPIHIMMLIPEDEYKNLSKIKPDVIKLAQESGENLWVHIKTVEVDLWNYGLDSKYEFLDAIAASFPLHDSGILGGLRLASIHKNLTLNWLNSSRVQYVATYAIGGSLVRGTADETSDVDTIVIIDDTDVKRMSRVELLEKLRGRIVGDFWKEASALAGVKNPLGVQVWLLTDFWQRVKDAEPVAFTFIRDAVPLYDRGTFIPWKRLLQMGRIKPSPEAIDLYMKEGERTEELIKRRMLDAMIDIYYGVLTPTQAMMMLAGHAPPVPKTAVKEVEEVLVKKEKVMTAKDLKTLEKAVKLFKDYEHGRLKEISGKEIDEFLKEGMDYAKRMRELRTKLEKRMQEHQEEQIKSEITEIMKTFFGDKSPEELVKSMRKELVSSGKLPERMAGIAEKILIAPKKSGKKKEEDKAMSQSEMQRLSGDASELIGALTEYSQRKEFATVSKHILQITFGDHQRAEIALTEDGVFVVQLGQKISKVSGNKLVDASKEELEKALTKPLRGRLSASAIGAIENSLGDFTIDL